MYYICSKVQLYLELLTLFFILKHEIMYFYCNTVSVVVVYFGFFSVDTTQYTSLFADFVSNDKNL